MKYVVLVLLTASTAYAQTHISGLLAWKFGDHPGIRVAGDSIVEWPVELGSVPSSEELTTWTTAYEAHLLEVDQDRDVDNTNYLMARWVEHLTIKLVQKGVISWADDVPVAVRTVINERRTRRGDSTFP